MRRSAATCRGKLAWGNNHKLNFALRFGVRSAARRGRRLPFRNCFRRTTPIRSAKRSRRKRIGGVSAFGCALHSQAQAIATRQGACTPTLIMDCRHRNGHRRSARWPSQKTPRPFPLYRRLHVGRGHTCYVLGAPGHARARSRRTLAHATAHTCARSRRTLAHAHGARSHY